MNLEKLKLDLNGFKILCNALFILLFFIASVSCGGAGGGSGTTGDWICYPPGISIDEPFDEGSYATGSDTLLLSGYAPLASHWDDCYPCVPTSPGVTVTWYNEATGKSGIAFSWVSTGWFFGYPIYSHHWSQNIKLMEGENPITLTADQDGKTVGENCITVSYIPDLTAPTIPTNLTATSVASTRIDLSWNVSIDDGTTDDAGVEGYNIYRDGTHIRNITSTSFTDSGLSPEAEYCYVISANDSYGNDSPMSKEVCTDTSWVTSYIGNCGGSSTSIAVDLQDRVHISYSDGYPRYITNVSGAWIDERIGGERGTPASITVDPAGNVHIGLSIWFDIYTDFIKYATNASGSWVFENIYSGGNANNHSSIALDSLVKVHIGYSAGTRLGYATNASGAWEQYFVDSHPSGTSAWVSWTSIAIDSFDKVHISNYSQFDYDVMYSTNASGNWITESIDRGDHPSIAVDSNDGVHISYTGYDNMGYGSLMYATNAAGDWLINTIERIEGMGKSTSIAIDSLDIVHISYLSNNALKYATNASGSWATYMIDKASGELNYGYWTAIALDTSDKAHISYYSDNGCLKYATNY